MNTESTRSATVMTSLRLPVELKTWLQHEAVDNHRSLPGEVIARLDESRKRQLADQQEKRNPISKS